MELRIETAEGFNLPRGCFIGVRIGDVLKQRRYDPKGCYQFPLPEHRRNAKIDLYQHVGTCSVSVGPEGKAHEVSINSLEPSAPDMRLKVNTTTKATALADRESKMTNVKREAMDYLAQFQIQERLGEAVKMLLQKRPEDPIDFICDFLKGNASATSKPAAAAAATSSKSVPTKSAGPPPVKSVLPLKPYYLANLGPAAQADCWQKLHSKFPPAKRAGPQKVYAAAPKMKFSATPSIGTWLAPKPKGMALVPKTPAAYAKAAWNLKGMSATSMSIDERCEVERMVTRALSEMTGELEGEYYPLPGSKSCIFMPGGMSEEDQLVLNSDGLLFKSPDPAGRGVFANNARDVAVWVNGDHHLQILVKEGTAGPQETLKKLRAVESAVRMAVSQEGYDFAEPFQVSRRIKGMNPVQSMSTDEASEVERILTRAFLEYTGELEGEYFPMPTSKSYPPRPGGMSSAEEALLTGQGVAIGSSGATGRGIFASDSGNLVVVVNGEQHVQFVAKRKAAAPVKAAALIKGAEDALREAVRQSGYDLV
eukprot:CAMPEP_0197878022 /NCGR_PEP_ID=MMETSP1439-20131203/6518_1 /TAXON_ID=66791 /ORGANISM="Gonyaulax spinifera, Strain CCMP409" /LENGTH=536 /DNA_ID=CAMNT_0043497399 /DNA_START=87 /DNA_END=1697 /DNA_ORIENTATION=-